MCTSFGATKCRGVALLWRPNMPAMPAPTASTTPMVLPNSGSGCHRLGALQYRPKPGKRRGALTFAIVANDQMHRFQRKVAGVRHLDHVFARAHHPNAAEHLGVLHRAIPLACTCHENRHGLLRVDVHADRPALRAIGFAAMEVGWVQPHGFLCAALPLEYLLLSERWAGVHEYN